MEGIAGGLPDLIADSLKFLQGVAVSGASEESNFQKIIRAAGQFQSSGIGVIDDSRGTDVGPGG